MSQINYKSKYLKYKTKYLFIKNNQIDQGFRSSLNLLNGGAANPVDNPVDNLTFKRNFGIELDKLDIPPDNIDPLELQRIYYENIKKQKLQEQEQKQELQKREQELQKREQELQKQEQELQKLKDDIKKQELELQKKEPVTQTSTSQSVTQSIVSNVSNVSNVADVAESKNLEQRLYESKQNEFS
jgi:hypothetical protein